MTPEHAALLAAARAFRDDDPDPETRAESDALIARATAGAESDVWSELEERFGSELSFGTAGLRGLIGAGSNRMNRRTVARTTTALCTYLARTVPNAAQRGLCLGYDGRHQSRAFADEVAAVAWGAGFVVHMFDAVAPTPLVAFSVRDRGAAAGVVITASHNPAAYNGYKIYLGDGAQLRGEHEVGVARELGLVREVLAFPRLSRADALARNLVGDTKGVADRYIERVAAAVGRDARVPLPLIAAYTAMHGVGEPLARRVFERIGAARVDSVAEQAEPDPAFPTVAFPNPEEPGALDRVLALAERVGADLAIANDPDADRLALCARRDGALAALSGNEIGVLLADYLLERSPRDGKNLIVSTIVSTPLLERIASDHDARCERTLTGFKWIIGRALVRQASHGWRCVLGFEEALGYCIGDDVRDKDGIAAAAHALHMAELHAREGRTLHGALERIYRRHGLCESTQVSITRGGTAGIAEIRAAMERLRSALPISLAGLAVRGVVDLARGTVGAPPLPAGVLFDVSELPASDVIALELQGAHRITVRPSGTEPKLKLYVDVWVKLENGQDLAAARSLARAQAMQLVAALRGRLGL